MTIQEKTSEQGHIAKCIVYISFGEHTEKARQIVQDFLGDDVHVSSVKMSELHNENKINLYLLDTWNILHGAFEHAVQNTGSRNCKVIAISYDKRLLDDIQAPSTWVQFKMVFDSFDCLTQENQLLLTDALKLSRD